MTILYKHLFDFASTFIKNLENEYDIYVSWGVVYGTDIRDDDDRVGVPYPRAVCELRIVVF